MSKNELDLLLDKLKEQVRNGENTDFSTKEISALRRVIRTYEMLESWGRLGRILIWAAMTTAVLMTEWSKVREAIF